MTMFDKNIKVLAESRPDLAYSLGRVSVSDRVEVLSSKSGLPVIKVDGISLHSQYDPVEEAAKVISTSKLEEAGTVVVLGMALGYHVDELLKSAKKIIIVEPSLELLRVALETRDFSRKFAALEFIVAEDPIATYASLACNNGAVFVHQGSARVSKKYFDQLLFFLEKGIEVPKLKILLIGPLYGGSLTTACYVHRALLEMGHVVDYVDCSPFSDTFLKINGISKNKINEAIVRSKFNDFLGEFIMTRAVDFSPDLIIALAQAPLSPPVINRLKESEAPIAFWFVEDFRSLTYWEDVAPHYDYFFAIQRGEFFEKLDKIGVVKRYYLPQACSPEIHNAISLSPEEVKEYGSDISFIGAGYYNRQKFFPGLTDFNFKIWGSEWNMLSVLGPHLCKKGKRLEPEEYVKIFSASKININLHSSTYHEGIDPTGDFVNPRTFEIASCDAFQLVDKRSELSQMFEDGKEIVTFDSLHDLREKIDYYLVHAKERGEIAQMGRERVHKNHTFRLRLEFLLKVIVGNESDRIQAKIAERDKCNSGENSVQGMLDSPDCNNELVRFLEAYRKREGDSLVSIEKIMKQVEEGSGSITRAEAIFMMMNQIVTENK